MLTLKTIWIEPRHGWAIARRIEFSHAELLIQRISAAVNLMVQEG